MFAHDHVVPKGKSRGGAYVGKSPGHGPIAISLSPNPVCFADEGTDQSLCIGPRGCDGDSPSGDFTEFTAPGDPQLTPQEMTDTPRSYRPFKRDHRGWWAQKKGFEYLNRSRNSQQPHPVCTTHAFHPLSEGTSNTASKPLPALSSNRSSSSRISSNRAPIGPFESTYCLDGGVCTYNRLCYSYCTWSSEEMRAIIFHLALFESVEPPGVLKIQFGITQLNP